MERVFLKPGAVTRWPLYLRQAKAVLRAGDEGFDERKYGFAGLVEALRFGQREGLFRLDRDRQGVLRVYPGQLLQRADGGSLMPGGDVAPAHREPVAGHTPAPSAAEEPMDDAAEPIEETAPAAAIEAAAAPAAKASKRRGGAAKKPAAAKKAGAQGARRQGRRRRRSAPRRRRLRSRFSRPRCYRDVRSRCRSAVSGRGRRRRRARTSPSPGADIVTGTTCRRSSSL